MTRTLTFLMLLLSLAIRTQGQIQSVRDSLSVELLDVGEDTMKVTLLVLLSHQAIDIGDVEEGEDYADEAISLSRSLEYEKGLGLGYSALARTRQYKGDYDLALRYYAKALQFARLSDAKHQIMEIYKSYADIYAFLGQYKSAYLYQRSYAAIKDSIFNSENSLDLFDLRERYEEEKKQQEREFLTKENEHQHAVDEAEHAKHLAMVWFAVTGLGLVLLFAIFIFNRFRVTNRQKCIIEDQKLIVEEKNREVTASIVYAKRIQEAILPPQTLIDKVLPNAFFMYRPKDIVSGDFYWVDEQNERVYFAAVDCTGHGVPGALVSIIGHNGLTRAIHEFQLTQPGAILDKLNELVEVTLRQRETEVRDGMDIALCCLNYKSNEIEFAGANNPLYLIRDGVLSLFKADKQPIGKYDGRKPFENHRFTFLEGDTFYIFSDGMADQFGGSMGKKFKYKAFRELLLNIQDLSMSEQMDQIDTAFTAWKGEFEQVDDVCIVGVRV